MGNGRPDPHYWFLEMNTVDKFDSEDLPPSKSQLKRDTHALQQLGSELLEIPESDWDLFELSDELTAALRETKRIRSHSARKRQLQYIGKLMRNIEAEPIRQYFEQRRTVHDQQTKAHHELEIWRDRLIGEGDLVIEEFLKLYTAADRQHLRQLVRQVTKEAAQNKPPKSSRALFRYIREIIFGEQVGLE